MANQLTERINAPPIHEFKSHSQQAVEQLPAIFQDTELSEGMRLPGELELTREPNSHRNILCKTKVYLNNEMTILQGGGGNLEGGHRIYLQANLNFDWWDKQTVEVKEKFHGITTIIIEWFHTYLTIPLQSICQYFEQEIRLTKGHVNSLLLRLSTNINLA